MPKQKDLKRLVRARMQKTGEAYTAARLRLPSKKESAADLAGRAGVSDAAVRKATGRAWREWVRVLDAAGSAERPHREIGRYILSLGVPSWWSQTVTVGYERIRGLRERGQRRGGGYTATKSRTFPVSLRTLFDAFDNPSQRGRWLAAKVVMRSATAGKRMRLMWEDGTAVLVGFVSKGDAKSSVAIEHQGLSGRAAMDAMKKTWSEAFDRLGDLLS